MDFMHRCARLLAGVAIAALLVALAGPRALSAVRLALHRAVSRVEAVRNPVLGGTPSLPLDPNGAFCLASGPESLVFEQLVYAPLTGRQQTGPDGKHVWQPIQIQAADGQMHKLTGRYIQPNSAVTTEGGLPAVDFSMTSEGAKYMGEATQQLIGKPMAIFLDNHFISAPTVQSQITDNGVIVGLTLPEAQALSALLNGQPRPPACG